MWDSFSLEVIHSALKTRQIRETYAVYTRPSPSARRVRRTTSERGRDAEEDEKRVHRVSTPCWPCLCVVFAPHRVSRAEINAQEEPRQTTHLLRAHPLSRALPTGGEEVGGEEGREEVRVCTG